MASRRCIDCDKLCQATRCKPCAKLREGSRRPSFNERYGPEYQRNRRLVLERDGHECQISGAGCTLHATTADHILPREHGGGHGMDNLRAACAHCNTSRGARPGGGLNT